MKDILKKRVYLIESYGHLKPDTTLEVIDEGYDWYKVRYQGKSMYIPKSHCHA